MLINKINSLLTQNHLPCANHTIVVDSGATTHAFTKENTGIDTNLVHVNLPFSNVQSTDNGIKVKYPDGVIDQATHTATLDIPSLPLKARQVHLFRKLASGSLLSLGQLCDAGCTAYFNKKTVYIFYNGKIIMQGTRSPSTNQLWQLNPETANQHNSCHSLNAILDNPTIAERIKFYHASMFSPPLQTLATAIDAGYLTTFPSFTTAQLRKYPPRSEATVNGHLRAIKKNLTTVQVPSPSINNFITAPPRQQPVLIEDDEDTPPQPQARPHGPWQRTPFTSPTSLPSPAFIQPTTPPSAVPTATPTAVPTILPPPVPTAMPEPAPTQVPTAAPTAVPTQPPMSEQQIELLIKPTKRTNHIYTDCTQITGQVYTDQTGKMLIPSASGMNYCLIFYDFDSNLIWAVPLPSRTKHQILKAMKQVFKLLGSRGLQPQLQRLDNECSQLLKDYMSEEGVAY